jgi:adenylate cyclase
MNWKAKLVVRESIFTAIVFTAAAYSYYMFAFWGAQDHFTQGPLQKYLTSHLVHVELLMVGILFGVLIAIINRISDTPALRKRPVIQLIVYRTILYIISFAVVGAIVLMVFALLIYPWEKLIDLFDAVTYRYFVSFGLWLILAVAGINVALEISRLVGPGRLTRLLLGRYRKPSDQERIFLFMDMKGSTATAEKLGHTRYSELMQECYHDLTQVVMQFGAEIYQYVGDEVVVSWPLSMKGKPAFESVQFFFAYQEILKKKGPLYAAKFGLMPEFRGGIDVGAVTVIEIGDVKRDIAYYGDVLNTSARILDLCKTRKEKLMVSERISKSIGKNASYRITWEETVSLRGKKLPVHVCSIHDARDS